MRSYLFCALAALVILLEFQSGLGAESLSVVLQKGIFAEETEGNLDAAIKIYEEIVEEADANRSVVARPSKQVPAVSVDDACDDLPTSGRRDFTAAAAQLFLVHAYNQIALAERFPIKSVGPIQDDFGCGRHAHTTLGGTEQDFDKRFVGDAQGVRDDHARMLALASIV